MTAYERHHQALYRYCRSIVHHEQDAQDALQSTLTRAYAALPDEPRTLELKPWLFRIAHNEAVSILRRRRSTVELDESLRHPVTIEDGFDAREALRVLRRDIADLPERQRAALVLRELNGLGLSEIAQVLETTPAAVKQAIFDARRALSHCRDGRALTCREVQRVISDGDGRRIRSRGLRAHVRECSDCRRFQADLARRPAHLAALAPPLPAAVATAILAAVSGTATTTVVSTATAGLSAKLVLGFVLATGSATAVEATRPHHHPAPVARVAPARTPAASRTPAPALVDVVARKDDAQTVSSAPAARTVKAAPGAAKRRATPVATATPRPEPAKTPHAGKVEPPPVHAVAPQAARPPEQAGGHAEPPGQAKKNDQSPPITENTGQSSGPTGTTDQSSGHEAPSGQIQSSGESQAQADTGGVPPGQAKKDGEPPGQAKKDGEQRGQANADGNAPDQQG